MRSRRPGNQHRGPFRRTLRAERLEDRFLLSAGPLNPDGHAGKLFEGIDSVDLQLTPPGPVNQLEITVTAEAYGMDPSDSDTAAVTGNMVVDLGIDFDEVTHEITSVDQLEFSGGRIRLSDVEFTLSFGIFLGTVEAEGSGLGGTLDTPNPPGMVTGGTFNTAEHLVILNEGQFHAEGTGLVGLLFEPITINLADAPIEATGDMIGYLDASLLALVDDTAMYDVTLSLPVDFDEVVYQTDDIMVTVAVTGILEASGQFTRTLPLPATIEGRHVFYNNSFFDGNDPAPNGMDDEAVAPDKQALLPGQTATLANYTSYTGGINGIMVDVAKADRTLTLDDFAFKVGNDNDPQNWPAAPPPAGIAVRPGAGDNASDRVTIIWANNDIQKEWLQVTVLAGDTGLVDDDVFYFGNAIGETGNSTTEAKVNAVDMLGARNNQRNFFDPAPIDFAYDFDRNARVNASDMLIARNNTTHFLNALQLITAASGMAAADRGASAHDALFEQAGDRGLPLREVPNRASDWLHQFEQPPGRKQLRGEDRSDSVLVRRSSGIFGVDFA